MLRNLVKKKKQNSFRKEQSLAQVTMEFVVCLMVVILMAYSVLRIFHWTGKDLALRRKMHEEILTMQAGATPDFILSDYSDCDPFCREFDPNQPEYSNLRQIDPFFYFPRGFNALWDGQL